MSRYGAYRSRLAARRDARGWGAGAGGDSCFRDGAAVACRDAIGSVLRAGVDPGHRRDELVDVLVADELGERLTVLDLDLAADPVVEIVARGNVGALRPQLGGPAVVLV